MEHPSELRLDVHFKDNDSIPLDALTVIVSALESLLHEYESVYLEETDVSWNISTLGLASIDVGITPQIRSDSRALHEVARMTQQFVRDARSLETGSAPEEILPGNASRAWIRWMRLFRAGTVTTFSLRTENESALMTREGAGSLELSSERQLVFDTLRGTLNGVNFAGANYFTLYRIEGGRALRCYFPDELQTDVIAALRKRVDVSGRVRTNSAGEYQSMRIDSPPRILRSESEIPRVRDLVGIAPELTEGLDVVEWVRRQRIE